MKLNAYGLTLNGLGHPRTRAAIDKRLVSITAGRTLHKPTVAHPYASCFGLVTDRIRRCDHGTDYVVHVSDVVTRKERSWPVPLTCEQHIRRQEAACLPSRPSHYALAR